MDPYKSFVDWMKAVDFRNQEPIEEKPVTIRST